MLADSQAATAPKELIFYDGGCGLCHAMVRFTAKRDHVAWFGFAPLGGQTFHEAVRNPPPGIADSMVVKTAAEVLLTRSAAVLYTLQRLGGGWRVLGAALGLLPRALLDWSYDAVARLRRKLFAPPRAECPPLPPRLRSRFLP